MLWLNLTDIEKAVIFLDVRFECHSVAASYPHALTRLALTGHIIVILLMNYLTSPWAIAKDYVPIIMLGAYLLQLVLHGVTSTVLDQLIVP